MIHPSEFAPTLADTTVAARPRRHAPAQPALRPVSLRETALIAVLAVVLGLATSTLVPLGQDEVSIHTDQRR